MNPEPVDTTEIAHNLAATLLHSTGTIVLAALAIGFLCIAAPALLSLGRR